MKKILTAFLFTTLVSFFASAQTPFTAGNIVVYRVGNGTDSLSSAGFAVFIDEYTTGGAFVQSHPLPTVINGINRRMIGSGSATSEGQITLSPNKLYLAVTGYDTFPDPARLSIANSSAAVINRVVGIMSSDGTIDASTALTDAYISNNFRGAVTDDGTNIWTAGTGTPAAAAGVRYMTKGSTTSTQLSTTPTNIRIVNIFNNQLYVSTGSGAFKAISQVGTGLPTAAAQTITVLPGFPNVTTSTNDPYGFSINPAGTIAYLADNRSRTNGGGVQKWLFDGANWNLTYTLDSGLTTGLRSLTVDWSAANPVIYAVSGEQAGTNKPGNKLLRAIDIDSTSKFDSLAIAGINTIFRGIAFAPESGVSVTTYTFTGNGNWDVAANWSNNTIPPNPLAAGTIVIDHTAGGSCILNVNQTVSAGASFTVNTGKNLLVQGALTVQ